MDRIEGILRSIARQHQLKSQADGPLHTTAVELTEQGVLVSFRNGRQQSISVSQHAGFYRLVSVILKRRSVEKIGRKKILPFIWLRNRETNTIAFSLDRQGRLIGSIEQLSETADAHEVFHYLEYLAWECDQLEYLLQGVEDTK